MENKLPTIRIIAKALKVSVSTVSRALKNNPRIGVRTREQVQQMARDLHYEPNRKAILFKQQRTAVIGVVLPYISEGFFSTAISGIEDAAIKNDYTILFGQSHDDTEKEIKVVEAMKRQRVDGLIISLAKQTFTYDHLTALDSLEIPVVYFDRVPAVENVHKVFCNLYEGTIEMITWLFNRGCRRIAFINGPVKMVACRERLKGYIEAISRQKIKVDMQLVENTDLSRTSTIAAMDKLLSMKKLPDAVVSFNDYVHMEAVKYAESKDIRINRDIVFVSYANLDINPYTAYPPIISVEQYPYLQGEKSMEMMTKILKDKEAGKPAPGIFYSEEITTSLAKYEIPQRVDTRFTSYTEK